VPEDITLAIIYRNLQNKHNKSINLTGMKRVLKRWEISRPAGYYTVMQNAEYIIIQENQC